MSNPSTGILSSPTIYGAVDYGPTFGKVWRPVNTKRIVTVYDAAPPGNTNVTIIPFDVIVIVQFAPAAVCNVILPDLSLWMKYPYGGFDLTIKNNNVGFDMTIFPFGVQTIDGLASLIVGGGQGEGAVVLSPLNDFSGWMTL